MSEEIVMVDLTKVDYFKDYFENTTMSTTFYLLYGVIVTLGNLLLTMIINHQINFQYRTLLDLLLAQVIVIEHEQSI